MKSSNKLNLAKGSISIILSVIIIFSCFQVLAEEWTVEQKEVWTAVEEYFKFIENGDVESAMLGIHESALFLYSNNSSPYKKNQIRSVNSSWIGFKPTVKLKPISITIFNNNVAIAFYYFHYEITRK